MRTDINNNDKVTIWMRALRRNTLIALITFVCIVLIAAATVTDSAGKLVSAYNALFRKSNSPTVQSASRFKDFKDGDPIELRWMVERLIQDKVINGFVWGDYQINMTMDVDTSAYNVIAFTGLLTNVKGPQFNHSKSYALTYDLTPTNRSTSISFSGSGIPFMDMDNMRISEAAYYQEQWENVRLMIMLELESNMTIRVNNAVKSLKN